MGLMKPRVSSYVDRGNELIAKGKTKQAISIMWLSRMKQIRRADL